MHYSFSLSYFHKRIDPGKASGLYTDIWAVMVNQLKGSRFPLLFRKIKISIKDPCRKRDRQDKQSVNSPINADGAEIEDARRTHHHIQSDKDVTVDLAKAPLSHHLEENKQQQRTAYGDSKQNKATALLSRETEPS